MNEQLCVYECVPVQFGRSCVVVKGVIAAWNRKSVGQNNNDCSHDPLHPTPYPGVCVCVSEIEGNRKGKNRESTTIHHLNIHWDVYKHVIGFVCLDFCPLSLLFFFCSLCFLSLCLYFSHPLCSFSPSPAQSG